MRALATALAGLSIGVMAHGADPRRPATAAETVSNLYTLTEGARTRCRHAPPQTAAAHAQALSRFTDRHPVLMTRLLQSPHYEGSRRLFAREAAYDPSRDTAQSLDAECTVQAGTLHLMTTTPAGLAAVKRYEAILSR